MKTVTIPKGFKVVVHSWENDGDAPQECYAEGLDKHTARFVVELCKLHSCVNNKNNPGYGNLLWDKEEEIRKHKDAVSQVVNKYGDGTPLGYPTNADAIRLLKQFGLLYGTDEAFYSRVLNKLQVLYVPEDVTFVDVTDEF